MAGMLDANMGGLGALFTAGDKAAGSDYDPAANMMKALSLAQGITQYKQAAEDRAAMKEYFASGGGKSSPDGVSSIFRLMGAAQRFAGQNPELAKKYQEMALAQLQSVKDSGDITTYNYVLNRLTGVNASLAGDPRAWKEGTDQFGRAVLRGATPDAARMGEAVVGQNKIDPDQAISLAGKIAAENGVSVNAALDAMMKDPRLAPFAAVALKSIAEKQQNVALGPDMDVAQVNAVSSIFGRGAGTPGRAAAPGAGTPGRGVSPGTGNADLSLLVNAANGGREAFPPDSSSGVTRQNRARASGILTQANKSENQKLMIEDAPRAGIAASLLTDFKPEVFTLKGMAQRGVDWTRSKMGMLPPEEQEKYAAREAYIINIAEQFRKEVMSTGGKALTKPEMEIVTRVAPTLEDDPVRAWQKTIHMALGTAALQRKRADLLSNRITPVGILESAEVYAAKKELSELTSAPTLRKLKEKYPDMSIDEIRNGLVKDYLSVFSSGQDYNTVVKARKEAKKRGAGNP